MQRVVVIGASIGGLSAAKALAPHVNQITVIERDELDPCSMHRLGAPQSQHQHALLARGRMELDALYPGFSERLLEGGAHLVNPGLDFAFLGPSGWMKRQPGVEALFQSRTLLENTLRSLAVEQIPNLTIHTGLEVSGLLQDLGGKRVRGVTVRDRSSGAETEIEADLVVDASGRSSRSMAWLEELGHGKPEETIVDAHCGYSSRWYAAPSELPAGWWWRAAYSASSLRNPMGGSIAPTEGGRWLVTTWGYEGHYPPTDPTGFSELLSRGLATPLLGEMVRFAEPISPIYSFKGFVNRRRWFSRWEGLPAGYLSVGDVGCVFNPVHGQGMTSAVLAARSLQTVIERDGLDCPDLSRRYYRYAEKVQDVASQLSCSYDLRFPSASGERPRFFSAQNWFFDRYADAAQDKHDLYMNLMKVMHLINGPDTLATPRIVTRVLTHAAVAKFKGGRKPPSPMPAFDYRQPPIRDPAGKPISGLDGWRTARIVRKQQEADGIYSFLLESADDKTLPLYSAGSHIDVRIGSNVVRQYSLCNESEDTGRFLICVQREGEGRGGSKMLCDELNEGDSIGWRGPRQMFALADSKSPALLLAGGIGVTPLIAMAQELDAAGTPFELHVFVRSAERLPFAMRLAGSSFASSVFIHRDDAPSKERVDLTTLLDTTSNRHLYVCGPSGFIEKVLSTARTNDWAADRIHVERFSADTTREGDASADAPFTITLARSGRTLEVAAEQSALSVLHAAGYPIQTSCETGVCGTCITTVLSGEIDHRDHVLTPRERDEGKCFLPCCSRAKSPVLVLDL